jgi:hypothetical protein
MKTILSILFYFGCALQIALCSPPPGAYPRLQTLRGTYEWAITEERILATPAWTEPQPIPLAIDKACQLARDWLVKHDDSRFKLMNVELFPYRDPSDPPAWYPSGRPEDELRKRYYYRVSYASRSQDIDAIDVYVLLDGTVVEPKIIAPPPKAKAQ